VTQRHALTAAERDAFAAHERDVAWAAIRSAALDAILGGGGTYDYHDGHSTHRCRTMVALAAATRRERRRAGAQWPED
jgi:hypothetical protein